MNIKNGPKQLTTVLLKYVWRRRTRFVSRLSRYSSALKPLLLINIVTFSTVHEQGRTLLHLAVESGSPETVALLADKGAGLSNQDIEGRTT